MGIAQELIDHQSKLEMKYGTYHSHCDEIAKYFSPRHDEFYQKDRPMGEKRQQWQYDPTPGLASQRFASIIESLVCPKSQIWHGLQPEDDALRNDHEAMLWFEAVRDALFKLRYSGDANFGVAVNPVFTSMGLFGSGVLQTETRPGKWLRYRCSHIKEHFFEENADGVIDADWRKYQLTARQAVKIFGEGNLSERVVKSLDKEPNRKFDFLHCVFPNEERVYGAMGPRGMAYASFHVDVEGQQLCSGPKGFRKFPFIIARYMASPTDIMGTSPAMMALPEVKMLMQMRKTDIRARHLAVDPPNLAANEASIRRFNVKPGAMNYGTLSMEGNQLVKPYQTGGRIDLSVDGLDQSRRIINDIFLVTLFQILVETPEMTATEVLARQQEKGDLLSPVGGMIESEFLSKLIERELDEMAVSGMFDEDGPLPMPASVRERGGAYSVNYSSPMVRYRLSGPAAGAEKMIQSLLPIAQIDPTVWDVVNFSEYAKLIAEASGAPVRVLNSPEVRDQKQQSREQQQQMAALSQAAPAMASSIKDIAQAQALAG